MKVRKYFLVSALVASFWNFIMMFICSSAIDLAIPIVMPLGMYKADQFMMIAICLSLGTMAFGNIFLIKTGIYDSIKRHIGN